MPPLHDPDNDGAEEPEEGNEDNDAEDDDDDDGLELNPTSSLPDYAVKRVEKLQALDAERETIMDQYLKERSALEQKFASLLKPLYEQRGSIVKGDQDEEIAKATGSTPPVPNDGTSPVQAGEPDSAVITGIPHFWVTALSNHETVGELISEEDVDCLEHLQDVVCIDHADGKGFVVQFKFGPNDYFTDTVLTKTYEVPNLLLSDEPMLKQVKGCTIHWKTAENSGGNNNDNTIDRCLTYRKVQKKQRGKGKKAGQIRTITKVEKKESFFHWFETPPKMPNTSKMEQMDEEEVEEIEEQFTDDFEIAQALRSEICPRAVFWYTGEASEREMLEMMAAAELADVEQNDGAQQESS